MCNSFYKFSIDAKFRGANEICGISGCNLVTARELMNNLPGILPKRLYKHQYQRLVISLKKAVAKAILIINNERGT
ncbi:hypothetical protein [Okeania sp.]|uniref:hypothetical protein n=1 Tax=Okeania sp. TaxID=3100323 RepID=UPI002B4AB227|nr:hypothetical protein [Okeania sp.]